MNWFTGIVLYILIWWVVIFIVLPYGNKPAEEGTDMTFSGAPENPRIKEKLLATSAISALIWIVAYFLITADLIDFRDVARDMHS